jgi:hypothetical protein
MDEKSFCDVLPFDDYQRFSPPSVKTIERQAFLYSSACGGFISRQDGSDCRPVLIPKGGLSDAD